MEVGNMRMTATGLLVPDDGQVHYRETASGFKVVDHPLIIGPDEHVFIAGRNGTGKTWNARQLHQNDRYVIIHDTKGDFKWPEVPKSEVALVEHLKELPWALRWKKKVVYRPARKELEWDWYEAFYDWVYEIKNVRVVVDELMQICPNPFKIPAGLKGIYTRGRSRRTTVTACTQRPAGIPQMSISEATFLYVHDLNLPQDRNKLVEVSGMTELWKRPGYHQVWFYKMGEDHPVKLKIVA